MPQKAMSNVQKANTFPANAQPANSESSAKDGRGNDDDDGGGPWKEIGRKNQHGATNESKERNISHYRTLFVQGFPEGWLPINFSRVFGRAGAVMDVVLPKNKNLDGSRAFAFVRMSSEDELSRAVEMLHRESFGGVKLFVQRARYGPELRYKKGGGELREKKILLQQRIETAIGQQGAQK